MNRIHDRDLSLGQAAQLQRQQRAGELKEKWDLAKKIKEDSNKNIETAEKNYHTFAKGGLSYEKMRAKKASAKTMDKVNDLKKYDSALDKLKAKKSEDTIIIKQLKEDISSIKKEQKNIKNQPIEKIDQNDNTIGKISNEDITSLIEWKNSIQPILYILIAGLIGLGGVIIKLLFF